LSGAKVILSFGDTVNTEPAAASEGHPFRTQDQLGLRFQSQKGLSEMLTIDDAVKPADN
jgi:hypothetical protein